MIKAIAFVLLLGICFILVSVAVALGVCVGLELFIKRLVEKGDKEDVVHD